MVLILKFLRTYGWPIISGVLVAVVISMLISRFSHEMLALDIVSTESLSPTHNTQTHTFVSYNFGVNRAAPSVVNIYTRKKLAKKRHPLLDDPFFRQFFNNRNIPQRQRMESSLGSGVIVGLEGYILTNHHVVDGADEIITLLYDGREAKAKIIGTDPETDLAVLKIDLDNLTPIVIADMEQVKVGDIVLAIGNPFGVGQSVSQGIVSAKGRKDLGLNTFENFIQTDAAINPGNSGGALVNVYGSLIGINSAILNEGSSVGIGFAIPADTAISVMESIVKNGRVIRGWLGVEAQQLAPQAADQLGIDPPAALLITDVQRDSPAYNSGVKPGDIVTHINGEHVGNGSNGMNLIARLKPGDPIKLEIVRRDRHLTVIAVAGTRPDVI